MPNYPGMQSHMYQHPSFFSLFLFTSHLSFPIPFNPPHFMPSSVLRIHLQIKQIHHSVKEAGKGGRLWNALALRVGKGSEHSATLPCIFPAVPALAFLGSVSCNAMPLQPSLPIPVLYLYQPNPPKPTELQATAQCLA